LLLGRDYESAPASINAENASPAQGASEHKALLFQYPRTQP